MIIVKVTNPYYEKTYEVRERKGDIECTLRNIERGNEPFMRLHDYGTGNPIVISPKNFASVEIADIEE